MIWVLKDKEGQIVNLGGIVISNSGKKFWIQYAQPPHKDDPVGKIFTSVKKNDLDMRSFPPEKFNLKWEKESFTNIGE